MINRIKKLIKTGEKINVELKTANGGLPKSLYESVCSFLNTKGGEIILGVEEKSKKIVGVPPEKINQYKKDFSSEINNPQKMFPTVYLCMEEYTIENKKVLYINIPEGSQAYKSVNRYYLRNYDGDYDITDNPNLMSGLFIRKSSTYTENTVYPYMTMDDLNQDIINKVRQMAVNRTKNHPWEAMDNLALLKSASLYRKDFATQNEGFTLACALLFGKDTTIQNILPHYRTDLIFKADKDVRYSDRDIVETNLIDSYDRIMRFVEKHLPSPFYLEKDVRIDIRNAIFRELAVNTLMHREFTLHNYARFIIEPDKIFVENANKPYICGNLKPNDFRPYTKNPTIAKIFKEIGYAEELGSGVRNIMKYSKEYFGSEPKFVDETMFTTTINITNKNLINHVAEQANKKSDIVKEKVTQSSDTVAKKGTQLSNTVSTKVPQSKNQQLTIKFCKTPKTTIEIMEHLKLKSKNNVLRRIINPLLEQELLVRTIPDKTNSSKQKYVVKNIEDLND